MAFEEIKASMMPAWKVETNGLIYKGEMFRWDEISDLKEFSVCNTPLTNGVYNIKLRGKQKNLVFPYKQKEQALEAISYIASQIVDESSENNSIERKQSIRENLQVYQELSVEELINIAMESIPKNEILYVALKGTFKEYLFCTDKMVYIVKKGFMTGHTFGGGSFKMPYSNITNVEVDYHLATGYFEVSAGGVQNKPLDYWNNEGNSPQKAPNAIALTSTNLRADFERAAQFILGKISDLKNPQPQIVHTVQGEQSLADKIRDLKALVDEGLLTEEEFEAKKKQLLGL